MRALPPSFSPPSHTNPISPLTPLPTPSNNYTLFVDLGETAYTASIVSFTKAKLTNLSTHWDRDLGGRDFDHAIATWAADKFVEKYPSAGDPRSKPKSW